jgi:abortive infection bacteriophage resistance protein
VNDLKDIPFQADTGQYLGYLINDGLRLDSDNRSRNSKQKAYHYISRVGVHRFHGYYSDLKPLVSGGGAALGIDDVLRLYKFDRKLRLLTLDAIERIEVATKTHLCNALSETYGDAFLSDILISNDMRAFERHDKKHVEQTQHAFRSVVANVLKSPENQEYRKIPQGKRLDALVPKLGVGHVAEAMSIGQASRVFEQLTPNLQRKIASKFGTNEAFGNWLWRFTHIRNAAAHHSRLWNIRFDRELVVPGTIHADFRDKRKLTRYSNTHYYSASVLMFHCLKKVARRTRWHWRLHSVLDAKSLTPNGLNIPYKMGFPNGWEKQEFWRGAISDVL